MKTPKEYDQSIIEIVDAVYGQQHGIERTRQGACVCRTGRCVRQQEAGAMVPVDNVGDSCHWCNDYIVQIDPALYDPEERFYVKHHSGKFVCCAISKEETIAWLKKLESNPTQEKKE